MFTLSCLLFFFGGGVGGGGLVCDDSGSEDIQILWVHIL